LDSIEISFLDSPYVLHSPVAGLPSGMGFPPAGFYTTLPGRTQGLTLVASLSIVPTRCCVSVIYLFCLNLVSKYFLWPVQNVSPPGTADLSSGNDIFHIQPWP